MAGIHGLLDLENAACAGRTHGAVRSWCQQFGKACGKGRRHLGSCEGFKGKRERDKKLGKAGGTVQKQIERTL